MHNSNSRKSIRKQVEETAPTVMQRVARSEMKRLQELRLDSNLHRDLEWGWMLPYLMEIDQLANRRWEYWFKVMESGRLPDEPIPRLNFLSTPDQRVMRYLKHCIGLIPEWRGGIGGDECVKYFFEWLLFGFGSEIQLVKPEEPMGCEGASMRLYQAFSLGPLLAFPYDYWGDLLVESEHGRRNGFFPTPHSLVEVMTQMVTSGPGEGDIRTKPVVDPCMGTGRMLLSASNFSLCLYGSDIDLMVVKAATINGYLYAPWMIKCPLWDEYSINRKIDQKIKTTQRFNKKTGRALKGSRTKPKGFRPQEANAPLKTFR